MFAGILVGNCLLNVKKFSKCSEVNFHDRDRGSKVIGPYREVKFSKSDFLYSDCRFGFFAKKYDSKVRSFF